MERQQHEMVLENTHASGAEDWHCPTCGRRMTITWQPWKRIILEPGDVSAAHSGSKGGLRVGPLQVIQGNADDASSAAGPFTEDPYLAPWVRWLDEIDSDDLWNRKL